MRSHPSCFAVKYNMTSHTLLWCHNKSTTIWRVEGRIQRCLLFLLLGLCILQIAEICLNHHIAGGNRIRVCMIRNPRPGLPSRWCCKSWYINPTSDCLCVRLSGSQTFLSSIVQKIHYFQIYLRFAFSQLLRWVMQMKLLECIKEDSNKIFHAFLLTSFKNWMLILVLLCENERQRWDASRYIKARSEAQRIYVYRDASHLWRSFSHNRTKINIQNL